MKKKQIERICGNCRLWDEAKAQCSIVVIHEGERIYVPMDATDPCLYEMEYFDPNTKAIETFAEHIDQVKFWVEDEKGEKTDGNGTVKIEYPKGFFGKILDDLFTTKDNQSDQE